MVIITGLCIGSFLNVCIYRIPRDESIIFSSSHCTNCNYKLQVIDLIPVLSYIFLKGRCRKCNEKISMEYPAVEILNGALYLIIYLRYGFSIYTIKYFLLCSLLIVIASIDLKTHYVYRNTILFGLFSVVIIYIADYFLLANLPWSELIGGAIATLIIGTIVFLTGGMGEGDIEISLIIGLFLGYKKSILSIFIAFILGGIVATMLLFLRSKGRKSEIAFGPYLAMAAIISILFGNEIINWYLGIL